MDKQQLIFVYNANSDLFSMVSDFAHKMISPSTYECHLCRLTYGNFFVKKQWKSFIDGLSIETIFLHKDQFEKQYELESALPAIYLKRNKTIEEIITKQEINSCETVEQLKNLVTQKLKQHVQHYHSNLQ